MATMRAKLFVQSVTPYPAEGVPTQETMVCSGVSRSDAYPADGSDEDNTYAKFSPSVSLSLTIANPVLLGKWKPGDKFYLDFTKIE